MGKYYSLLFQYCMRKLIKSWSFWLFVLFIICSYWSAMYQITMSPKEARQLYSCLTVLSNVSFGYIAGYIFYIVSDFFPSSKAQFIALQYIMLAEYEILTTISSFSTFVGENWVADFKTEYNMFKLLYCASNTFEKCGNEMMRLVASVKIKDSFVEHSKRMLEQTNSNFDCLLVAQKKNLSYEEFECLAKIKGFFCMENKNFENGYITVSQFEIDQSFQDYYNSQKTIIEKLKERAVYCIDEEYKQEIENFVNKSFENQKSS